MLNENKRSYTRITVSVLTSTNHQNRWKNTHHYTYPYVTDIDQLSDILAIQHERTTKREREREKKRERLIGWLWRFNHFVHESVDPKDMNKVYTCTTNKWITKEKSSLQKHKTDRQRREERERERKRPKRKIRISEYRRLKYFVT